MTAYISPQHNAVPCHGFGLSGSDRQTLMLGADATIAWVDDNGMAQAQDYFLGNYVQVKHISALCVTSRVDNIWILYLLRNPSKIKSNPGLHFFVTLKGINRLPAMHF